MFTSCYEVIAYKSPQKSVEFGGEVLWRPDAFPTPTNQQYQITECIRDLLVM